METEKLMEENFDAAISVVAHDMRNVVGQLYEGTKVLIEGEYDLSPEVLKILGHMSEGAKDGIFFLTEICEWAIEKNMRPEFLRFNAEKEIQRVIEGFNVPMRNKNISVDVFCQEKQMFSERRVFAIIARNIISNAIKFTPKGGNISISLQRMSDSALRFYVINNVEESELNIENFFGIQKSIRGTAGERGTGLGLSLVKKFSEMIGWIPDVSVMGHSICVSFTIPMVNEE